jgi:hypothetical protein
MKQKGKLSQGSVRDELASGFAKVLARDWAEHGDEVIVRLREEDPVEYSKLIARLVPQDLAPPPGVFSECQTMQEIGLKLLQQIGLSDPTEDQIAQAVVANDVFMATLEAIKDGNGAIQ